MSSFTAAQTTEWVANNLRGHDLVLRVDTLADQVLRIERPNFSPFIAGIVSVTVVEPDTVAPLARSTFAVEIIANVPSESVWSGAALHLAQQHNIATGSFGDLYRVLSLENVRTFQPSETTFIERGLRQHSRVTSFEPLYDRVYLVHRDGLPDVTAAMLNHYELTADHLRTARDRYGSFLIAVNTNPNGRMTNAAFEVADAIGVELLSWREFFSRLHKQ